MVGKMAYLELTILLLLPSWYGGEIIIFNSLIESNRRGTICKMEAELRTVTILLAGPFLKCRLHDAWISSYKKRIDLAFYNVRRPWVLI